MVTLLSSLLGLVSSLFPHIVSYFKDRADKKHELNIMNLQLKSAKMNIEDRQLVLESKENLKQIDKIYKNHDTKIPFIEGYKQCVMPTIALTLLFLYVIMEFLYFFSFMYGHELRQQEVLHLLWTDEDQAFFCCILSYYFGAKSFKKI